MNYISLQQDVVVDIIPENNPAMPGIPLSRRYPESYILGLIPVSEEIEVGIGYLYIDGEFKAPDPDSPDIPIVPNAPTIAERLTAVEDMLLADLF